MDVLSKATVPAYQWGEGCAAWPLADDPALSVKLERMPPGAAETRHLHVRAQQVFFVLSGALHLEFEKAEICIRPNEAAQVPASAVHTALNRGEDVVEFLVISAPSTAGDRREV